MRIEPAPPPEVLAAMRSAFAAAGGRPLDAPVAQPLSLYLDLAGEALRERLFLVQGPEGEEYCLRPDFTLAAALAHIESGAATGRYGYEGPAFRVAPAGSGRTEQFLQIGVEAFEAGDAAVADAKMAGLAWRAAEAGGRDDLTLLLGDVGLFATFLETLGLAPGPQARLKAVFSHPWRLSQALAASADGVTPNPPTGRLAEILAGLSEAEATGVLEEIWALAGIEPVGGRSPASIVHRLSQRAAAVGGTRLTRGEAGAISGYLAIAGEPTKALEAIAAQAKGPVLDQALLAWERRLDALAQEGVPRNRTYLATKFARAFGYYDGVLFEVRSAALGEDQPVGAGGRYDSLLPRLGSAATVGAVGCMVRPGRAWRGGAP